MTENEIKVKYTELHDSLSKKYYQDKAISKEDFDAQHCQVWEDMKTELISEGLLSVPETPRDLATEIDIINAEIEKLKEVSA